MRLTLRTLLAYMDDILEPADHEDLGKKIEASDFASELIHRSRDTVRRLRLGAPAVLPGDSDDVLESVDLGDANAVAEYLDNTLPPEQVADFERLCLEPGTEPDMHLAEVASCHHVLTMVLGEPAEVDAKLKARMYQLRSQFPMHAPTSPAGGDPASGQRLRIEPAHESAQQAAPATATPQSLPTPAAPPPAQPANLVESELPDYLREAVAAKRRSRRWAIATTLLVGTGLIVFWFANTPPAELPMDVAQSDIESLGDGEIDIEGLDELSADTTTEGGYAAGAAPPFVPESQFDPGDPESSTTTSAPARTPEPSRDLDAVPSGSLGSQSEPETAGAAREQALAADANQFQQGEFVVAPDGDVAGGDAPFPSEPETETELPAVADEAGQGGRAAAASVATVPELPPADIPAEVDDLAVTAEPLLAAATTDRPETSRPLSTPAELAATDTLESAASETPAPEPVGPQRLGNYLGNNDVLLIYSAPRDTWIRMPPRSPISTGDTLLTLPKFRTHVVLADVNAYLSGGTRLRLPVEKFEAAESDAELYLEIVYGRMLLNAGLKGSQVAIQVGEELREFRLASSASLAVEADRMFVPGSDYENKEAPIKATWHLTSGSVEWPTAAGGTQTIQAPAMWKTIDGIDEIPERIELLPSWLDREPVTDVERIAVGDLAKELVAGEPVGIRLLELTDGKGVGRKKEVRILAAASSLFVGEFEPLVKALNDSDQKRAWETHIADLRQALALSPDVAARVRQALVNIRGEQAAEDLMEMIVGYNSEQIGESREAVQTGALTTLLKWLDHDSLDYRVLAIHNLREITGGVTKGYRPDDSSKRRNIDLRKIWDQFEANELVPR